MPVKKTKKKTDIARLRKAINDTPRVVGIEAVFFFTDTFRKQGFYDNGLNKWPGRKDTGTKSTGRGLLMKTGRLRRSIRMIRLVTNGVHIGSDVPYARAHNEGFEDTVNVSEHTRRRYQKTTTYGSFQGTAQKRRKQTVHHLKSVSQVQTHTSNMKIPKRQFIGNSDWLNRKIALQLIRHFRKYI